MVKLLIFVLLTLVSVSLTGCSKRFKVEDVGKRQVFKLGTPFRLGLSFPMKLKAEGVLDGKALIYLLADPGSTRKINRPREEGDTLSLPQGCFNRELIGESAGRQLFLVYEPLTTVHGKVKISVNFWPIF